MDIIDGIIITDKSSIHDERGYVQHYMRIDNPEYKNFGEVYFSIIYRDVVKAWHLHTKMTLNYLCIYGMIKLVLFDNREASSTRGMLNEFFIGEKNQKMITVPKDVWNGFKGYGDRDFSIVANFTDIPHYKEEIIREFPHNNPFIKYYDWNRRDE